MEVAWKHGSETDWRTHGLEVAWKMDGDIGKRHGSTLEEDTWRHWKETHRDFGRRHIETLEEDAWRHWKETRGYIGRRHVKH